MATWWARHAPQGEPRAVPSVSPGEPPREVELRQEPRRPLRPACAPRTRPADAPVPTRGRPPRYGKRLTLHPHERALREAREQWTRPERKRLYRRRAEVELVIARAVRQGARQCHAYGLSSANLQAHSIAMTLNAAISAVSALAGPTLPGIVHANPGD